MKTKSMHFWTTGESFMNLLQDFFGCGEFYKYEQLLIHGLTVQQMALAFRGRIHLEGTTQDGADLEMTFPNDEPENFNRTLYDAILTAGSYNRAEDEYCEYDLDNLPKLIKAQDKNICTLIKYFTLEDIMKRCWKHIVENSGFTVTTLHKAMSTSKYSVSGLLLKTGEFVQCDYQGHADLYPLLNRLNLVNGGIGHHECDAVCVSSNQILGRTAYSLKRSYRDTEESMCTKEQLFALWECKELGLNYYGEMEAESLIGQNIYHTVIRQDNKGGKYGGLAFLDMFYVDDNIAIPTLSNYSQADWNLPMIIRSSPKYSMPGLLTSIVVRSEEDVVDAKTDIYAQYEKYQDVIPDNEIYLFYQAYIEGINGVANCVSGNFSMAGSETQGDIVAGKKGTAKADFKAEAIVMNLCLKLYKDLASDIQLEYVITPDNKVYIVQLRAFPKHSINLNGEPPADAIVIGKTFSRVVLIGGTFLTVDDILVVKEDCDSEKLLGKKALVVEADISFSHILALSKALKIPSIYATGPVDFGTNTEVEFNTRNTLGYIKAK